MKKKFFFLSLLLCIVCSCGENNSKYVIGISQCSNDEWRDKMNNELILEVMFHDNVEVEILSASDNNEKQIKDIQYFIDKKVDILVVSPNESAPVTPIVEKAFDLGIPVIVTDRKVLSEKYNAYIGPDNYEIGKLAGDYVVKYLNGNGNIVEIKGTAGSTPAIERHEGFMSIVRNYPEIKIIFQDDAVFLKSLGKKKMQEALKKHSKIDLVFAHNDRMAQGAYIAAQEMGREKKIRFVGIDAVPGYGIDQVIDGTLDVTFMNPTGGDKIIQLALDILNHNEFPTEITLPTNIVDKRNARVLKLQSDYIDQQKGKINSLNNKIDSYFARYATQRAMLYSSLILLLLVFILFFLTLKSNKSIKYLNSKLYKQNHETNSQKEQLEKQRDQLLNLSKQLEEATHSKLMFFTNISHDFLTPLTLVIEPIKQLILNRNLSRKQLKLLQLIEKNINILVHLVKQILDFRKYEEGKMELILSKNDLKVCLEEWNKIFLPSFINNKIKFSFNINENFQDYSVVFDQEKIQRIYFNLLSNALKFTNKNGKVHAELSSKSELGRKYAIIKISDNGIGISVEHIQNIFNKFYKIETHYAGSGIGLALVKSFVDLHKGEITVESNQGRGSTFTVKLPFEQQGHFELVSNLESNTELFFNDNEEDSYIPKDVSLEKPKELVLVIDDNPDIQEYLSLLLQEEYNVIKARDGKDGINKAMKYIPVIILCDVMMPVMDGLECCHWLKSEVLTCHIPIMMLTVSSQDEQRIEGFNSGADAYIAKPFNSKVLQTQIRTLIRGRKQLMEFFSDKSSVFGNTAGDLDKGFIEKIMCLIGENLSDSNLNIEDLGKMIGLSRVQLYRKVKSITNNSPNEIIRMCRLKKARSLLSASELSISEIAYEVGFSSPSYFTKCYKEYFNENPTVFLKRIKEGS